jgi:hypothetical protein
VEPKGKIPLGRPKLRWEDNNKLDLKGEMIGGVHWIDVAQGRKKWRAFLKMVMNIRIP